MSNPSIPINVMISNKKPHRSKEYIEERKKNEEALQGSTNNVKPPTWLNAQAKRIFKQCINDLKEIKLVTNLDVNTLAVYCDNVAKYSESEKEIASIKKDFNKFKKECVDHREIIEKTTEVNKLLSSMIKDQQKLADTIRKYAVEFGLTPQARAKLAIPREKKKKKSEEEEMFGNV